MQWKTNKKKQIKTLNISLTKCLREWDQIFELLFPQKYYQKMFVKQKALNIIDEITSINNIPALW
jgi:hypothetical protein